MIDPLTTNNVIYRDSLILSFNTFHGWDSLLFKMMKLCGESVAYPLELIFEAFLQNRVSLSAGKKLT